MTEHAPDPVIHIAAEDPAKQLLLEAAVQASNMVKSMPPVEPLRLPLPDPVPPLPGTLLREVDFFSSGRFSMVYRGTWTPPDQSPMPVAIKLLRDLGRDHRDRNAKRMMREASLWQKTQHPNIVPFYGIRVENEGKELMLVSQLCRNGNLREYLASHPELTLEDKLQLLLQAGGALHWLHQLRPQRIFHGDVRMENVLVKDDGEAALCDFGVAHVVHDLNIQTGLTASNPGGKGSKGFQAPEILVDIARPSALADVYAFGGLILAVLSGADPFHQIESDNRVMIFVMTGKRPSRDDHPLLPEADIWWPILVKCWAPEATDRITMADVVVELQKAIERQKVPTE